MPSQLRTCSGQLSSTRPPPPEEGRTSAQLLQARTPGRGRARMAHVPRQRLCDRKG